MIERIVSFRAVWLMVGAIVLSAVFKLSFLAHPFFGLEYEDAFIYSDVSRFLLYGYDWSVDPFQAKTCVDGSLVGPIRTGTFCGHYMVFPILVSLVHRIIGFSIYNAFAVNFVVSLVVMVVFIETLRRLKVGSIISTAAVLLLTTTPFLNLFNASGLAETLSSCFVMLAIYGFLRSQEDGFSLRKPMAWLFVLVAMIGVMTKRENLLLVFLPLASIGLLWIRGELIREKRGNLLLLFVLLLGLALVYNHIAQVGTMEAMESKDIGASTFSWFNFKTIFPEFIRSFLSLRFFGVTGLIFLIATVHIALCEKRFDFQLLLAVAWAYVFLYSAHYRSYRQVHAGEISVFETLRYSSNYLPIACLCISSFREPSRKLIERFHRPTGLLFLVLFIGGMFVATEDLRRDMSAVEVVERIAPVQEALKRTGDRDVIISDITSVFRLYADERREFLDIEAVDAKNLRARQTGKAGDIYLLVRKADEAGALQAVNHYSMMAGLRMERVVDVTPKFELLRVSY